MAIGTLDHKVRKAFSNAADDYDTLAHVHRKIGAGLAAKIIRKKGCQNILDIGCGTGWMTNQLLVRFPESRIIGIDFAEGMIKKARYNFDHLRVVQSDAHYLPFGDVSFEAVVSNLAFQWMDNLKGAFEECHRTLKSDGRIFMTLFGRETFCELFKTLEETNKNVGENKFQTKNRLVSAEDIQSTLASAGFKDIKLNRQMIRVNFDNMLSLMKWIKDIGANGLGGRRYLGKDYLSVANKIYNMNYKEQDGVYATLEVIWVEATK